MALVSCCKHKHLDNRIAYQILSIFLFCYSWVQATPPLELVVSDSVFFVQYSHISPSKLKRQKATDSDSKGRQLLRKTVPIGIVQASAHVHQ
jgi:hypothetical protein